MQWFLFSPPFSFSVNWEVAHWAALRGGLAGDDICRRLTGAYAVVNESNVEFAFVVVFVDVLVVGEPSASVSPLSIAANWALKNPVTGTVNWLPVVARRFGGIVGMTLRFSFTHFPEEKTPAYSTSQSQMVVAVGMVPNGSIVGMVLLFSPSNFSQTLGQMFTTCSLPG